MKISSHQQNLLKELPGVDEVIELVKKESFAKDIPKPVMVRCIREVIDRFRNCILNSDPDILASGVTESSVLEALKQRVQEIMRLNLRRLVNATGVVIHTNLGRSLLASEVVENITAIAASYSNLEFDLTSGERGSRYSIVEDILCEISGAESAMVVNNNAGAVLLCLETIAKGKEVIVSRGELVEIGGAFRVPDVMAKSGCILLEVGTTNRTHLRDFENAISSETGLLLKVHTSNYAIVGFTTAVRLEELTDLGRNHQIPVMEDLGSGSFIDFSQYMSPDSVLQTGESSGWKEPTVQDSISAGVDIVTFSGDKLLGGPQAGIILGSKKIMEQIRKNPLTRALRIDKLTLAGLESTLRLYRDPEKAIQKIPTLRMMTCPPEIILAKAEKLADQLIHIGHDHLEVTLLDTISRVGGGAMPILALSGKSVGIKIKNKSANALELSMRQNTPPIIGRIENDFFILDIRTIEDSEFEIISEALNKILKRDCP